MNYNRCIIGGTLTRDPELRNTQGGHSVTKIGVAVNRRFSSNGESREEVAFLDCEAWGKTAESIAQYFRKGSRILVEGRLKQESWEKEGEKRTKLIVVIDNFQFVDRKEGGQEPAPRKAPKPSTEVSDDDIPF